MFEITTTHYCSHMLRASSIEKLSLSCCRIDSRESTSKNTFQLNHTCVCYLGSWSFRLFSGTCCILTSCHKNHWTIKHNHSYMIHISFENSTNMNLKEDCFPQARKGGALFTKSPTSRHPSALRMKNCMVRSVKVMTLHHSMNFLSWFLDTE